MAKADRFVSAAHLLLDPLHPQAGFDTLIYRSYIDEKEDQDDKKEGGNKRLQSRIS